jgi:GMP synthase (glutamine-hydrolysing)
VHVLSVVHGGDARAELFAPVVGDAGHALDEWSFAWGKPPPRPLDSYDALLVFGGAMHADQDAHHPWLHEESMWLQGVLHRRRPVLGVCLGAQLLARATGAWVGRLPDGPEIGWHEVELTGAGAADPVLRVLPQRFAALQWHHYTYGLPAGAVELARSGACTQAFRLGEACWGVQFHPEVAEAQLAGWIADPDDPPPDSDRLLAETREQIGRWNELGRALCAAFLDTAERLLAAQASGCVTPNRLQSPGTLSGSMSTP